MTSAELQQKLQTGIEAVKRGQKKFAQELLLQVVEADEHNEAAWLWLSAAVDSLDDKITALENALHINPQNQAAQKGLASLRIQQEAESLARVDDDNDAGTSGEDLASASLAAVSGEAALSPQSEAAFNLAAYATINPIESVSAIDDPYQCLYCGAPAAYEMKRCSECGRSLVAKQGSHRLSATLGTAVFAMGVGIALAAIESIVLTVLNYTGQNPLVQYTFQNLGLELLFGDYFNWQADNATVIMWVSFGWLVVLIIVMLAFLYQISVAYYAAIGVMGLNFVWAVFRWINGYLGVGVAMPDLMISGAALSFIFASQRDFEVNDVRLRCAVDTRIKGGDVLHGLGHEYKRKGQWGLAVAYWRAAVGAMPSNAEFYKDLAIGLAQIGYYERALKALEEFSRQSPGHADYGPMKVLIQKKRTTDPRPRG